MHKKLILPLFTWILFIGLVSAADYGYSNSYTIKEKYDDYGYSLYQKSNTQTPWGEKTQITQIKDYDAAPYRYNDRYKNPVSDYWKNGPFHGYTATYKVSNNYNTYNTYTYHDNSYVDYHYSDSYNRGKTGSQYYDYYYYKPTKVIVYNVDSQTNAGSMYWDHGYSGWDCGNGYYCWKN